MIRLRPTLRHDHRRASARIGAATALAAGALALAVATGAAASPVRVEVGDPGAATLRLVDPATHARLATDTLGEAPLRERLVAPGNAVVAVRYGAADGGDGLALYGVPAAATPGAGSGPVVARVLDYHPRDGHLEVTLLAVPRGVTVQVQTGRRPPYWRKVFLYLPASDAWLEWPRVLAPADATAGIPLRVSGGGAPADPYTAWTRPLRPAPE